MSSSGFSPPWLSQSTLSWDTGDTLSVEPDGFLSLSLNCTETVDGRGVRLEDLAGDIVKH